jgi:hypothetical protein
LNVGRFPTWPTIAAFLAVLLAAAATVLAQGSRLGIIRKFMLPEYYDLPGQTNRVKTLVTGAEAIPLNRAGLIALNGVRIEAYSLEGRTNFTAETPSCVLDASHRSVSSTSHVAAASTDGRFLIEGTGFYLHMTNFHFIISNQVRTVIRQDLIDAATPATSPANPGRDGGLKK